MYQHKDIKLVDPVCQLVLFRIQLIELRKFTLQIHPHKDKFLTYTKYILEVSIYFCWFLRDNIFNSTLILNIIVG